MRFDNVSKISLVTCVAVLAFTVTFVGEPVLAQQAGASLPTDTIVSIGLGDDAYRWTAGQNEFDSRLGSGIGFASLARANDGRLISFHGNGGRAGDDDVRLVELNQTTLEFETLAEGSVAAGAVRGTNSLVQLDDGRFLGSFPSLFNFGFLDENDLSVDEFDVQVAAPGAFTPAGGNLAIGPDGTLFSWLSYTAPLAGGGFGIFSGLHEIDVASGLATLSGSAPLTPLNRSNSFSALAFDSSGRLFGFTAINAELNDGIFSNNSLYEIDLATGTPNFLTTVDSRIAGSIRGAVFVSVPEPVSTALYAPVFCFLAFRRRRS